MLDYIKFKFIECLLSISIYLVGLLVLLIFYYIIERGNKKK